MALDRDLNVAVVRAWRNLGHTVASGWEMLGATGARGLRIAHEAGPFRRFELTELHPDAIEVLAGNAERFAGEGVHAQRWDARRPLEAAAFDYVDLDPYGTPSPFLTAAFDALVPGGLLAVTATDTRVLAGVERGVAERRYGGRPVRGRLGTEGGLRLLLAELARRALDRGTSFHPRLAYVGDHHVRVYASISPRQAEDAPAPIRTISPEEWDGPTLPGEPPFGPMWLGPLFDPELIAGLQIPPHPAEPRRTERWLATVREEAGVDRPFYYEPNTLAHELGLAQPPSVLRLAGELARRGHRTAATHARAGAFRTDAPRSVVTEAARAVAG